MFTLIGSLNLIFKEHCASWSAELKSYRVDFVLSRAFWKKFWSFFVVTLFPLPKASLEASSFARGSELYAGIFVCQEFFRGLEKTLDKRKFPRIIHFLSRTTTLRATPSGGEKEWRRKNFKTFFKTLLTKRNRLCMISILRFTKRSAL